MKRFSLILKILFKAKFIFKNPPKKKISSNRQQLSKSFFLCHNFWVIRTAAITEEKGEGPWNFMGKFVKPYLVKNSIDIHTMEDFYLAKILINKIK